VVAAGRWFPCGSSVDENDANVPSAESLIRHVLYGNRWFRRFPQDWVQVQLTGHDVAREKLATPLADRLV
jgi:hypothetical protein